MRERFLREEGPADAVAYRDPDPSMAATVPARLLAAVRASAWARLELYLVERIF